MVHMAVDFCFNYNSATNSAEFLRRHEVVLGACGFQRAAL